MKKKITEEKYYVELYFQGDQFYLDLNLNTTKGIVEMKKEQAEDVALREYNKLRRLNVSGDIRVAVKKVGS